MNEHQPHFEDFDSPKEFKQRTTPWGSVLYKNERLGIEESEFSRNSHFYPEGEEIPMTRRGVRGLEVGYKEPLAVGAKQQVILYDMYVVFEGDNAVTQVDKRSIKYEGEEDYCEWVWQPKHKK